MINRRLGSVVLGIVWGFAAAVWALILARFFERRRAAPRTAAPPFPIAPGEDSL